MNILGLDSEYSSFFSPNRSKSGELLQLSIIPVIDGIKGEPFDEYIRPLTKVWNKHAEKVHGISRKRAEKFPHPEEVAAKLKKWIVQYDEVFVAVGHNCKGDKSYIDRFIADYGLMNEWNARVKHEWKDTKTIAGQKKSLIPTKNLQLETLCNFFKIQIKAHDALSDANATIDLLSMITSLISANSGQSVAMGSLSNIERRKKYIDLKYVQIGSDGCVFITEFGTGNKEALRTILEELWTRFVDEA